MRCRKVRSLLSTYCNGELTGRPQVMVKEHLAGCSSCRKEAATYEAIREAGQSLPSVPVRDDFNARLLNRIAEERFAETRTRAYLPGRVPWFRWRVAVPVVTTVALAVMLTVGALSPTNGPDGHYASVGESDAYQTVQPSDNPNMNGTLEEDWALDHQLAQMERFNRIASQLRSQNAFGTTHLTGTNVGSHGRFGVPSQSWNNRVRMQPVIRVYQSSGSTSTSGEVKKVY